MILIVSLAESFLRRLKNSYEYGWDVLLDLIVRLRIKLSDSGFKVFLND